MIPEVLHSKSEIVLWLIVGDQAVGRSKESNWFRWNVEVASLRRFCRRPASPQEVYDKLAEWGDISENKLTMEMKE